MLIPDTQPKGSMYTPDRHLRMAGMLDHPFQAPLKLPLHLQFAATEATTYVQSVRVTRMHKAQRLAEFSVKSAKIDSMIWERMPASVKVAAGKARFGFITVLMFVLRWPD